MAGTIRPRPLSPLEQLLANGKLPERRSDAFLAQRWAPNSPGIYVNYAHTPSAKRPAASGHAALAADPRRADIGVCATDDTLHTLLLDALERSLGLLKLTFGGLQLIGQLTRTNQREELTFFHRITAIDQHGAQVSKLLGHQVGLLSRTQINGRADFDGDIFYRRTRNQHERRRTARTLVGSVLITARYAQQRTHHRRTDRATHDGHA